MNTLYFMAEELCLNLKSLKREILQMKIKTWNEIFSAIRLSNEFSSDCYFWHSGSFSDGDEHSPFVM